MPGSSGFLPLEQICVSIEWRDSLYQGSVHKGLCLAPNAIGSQFVAGNRKAVSF